MPPSPSTRYYIPESLCCSMLEFVGAPHQQPTENCTAPMEIIQLCIISLSLACSFYTMWKIVFKKLFHNQFAFLIFAAQLSFALIGVIDILSKMFKDEYQQGIPNFWCRVVTPFVYGLILSTFLFIELFCVILYRKVMRLGNSFLENNLVLVCLALTAFCISLNFTGFKYFDFGICRNCTLKPTEEEEGQVLYHTIKAITYIDYFLPLVLLIYIIHLVVKIKKYFNNHPSEKKLFKILIIPLGNAIILIMNNLVSMTPIEKGSNNIVHIFLYESLYYVPPFNLLFYSCFVRSFELEEDNDRKSGHSLLISRFEEYPYRENSSVVYGMRY